MTVLALGTRRQRHPERGRNRGRRMGRTEGVVFAFSAARKTRNTIALTQRVHLIAPASEYLVGIRLMTNIPDQPVFRGIEDVMQRDRQLDRTEIGRQMAAGFGHRIDDECAQFIGDLAQLIAWQTAQVRRLIDCFEVFHS
jgi:ribosomal protein S14